MPTKVFIVDDHYMVIEGIRSLLQFEKSIEWVGHAANAESCLAFLQRNQPDIIFMDINMPVMDGKTCLTLLKSHEDLKDIPVVMWSTTLDKNEIEQLEQLGADFLSKPYNFETLVETLSGALSAKGLVNL